MGLIYSAMRIRFVRVEFPEEILPAEGRSPHLAKSERVYRPGDVEADVAPGG
jgi:hypothetical protein